MNAKTVVFRYFIYDVRCIVVPHFWNWATHIENGSTTAICEILMIHGHVPCIKIINFDKQYNLTKASGGMNSLDFSSSSQFNFIASMLTNRVNLDGGRSDVHLYTHKSIFDKSPNSLFSIVLINKVNSAKLQTNGSINMELIFFFSDMCSELRC